MRPRLTFILLLLLLFGIPALITINLVTSEVSGQVTTGAQPGGTIRGKVVDQGGRPLPGEPVEVLLVSPGDRRDVHAVVHASQDGSFEVVVPPHQGHYLLHAGGGERVRLSRSVSFLNRRGREIEPRQVELQLDPGCSLHVEFLRVDGRPLGSGRYELDGEVGGSGLFGLARPRLSKKGDIRDAMLELDGLPAMKAVLRARFASGDSVHVPLELTPGEVRRTVEL